MVLRMEHDRVDALIAQWRRERPDLDPSPMAVIGRTLRVARAWSAAVEGLFAERFGLQPGWFDVLSALRRAGPPFALSPTALSDSLMITSGGTTKRLDRMEAAGLVARRPDPEDRRGILVELTQRGREIIDAAVEAHLANEERLLAGLSPRERETLERLLRKAERGLDP